MATARTIAAQIVSGGGLLGAGAILRGNVGVTGITSAAALWAMAAVGMTAGAGYGGEALGLSGLIVAMLTVVSACLNSVTSAHASGQERGCASAPGGAKGVSRSRNSWTKAVCCPPTGSGKPRRSLPGVAPMTTLRRPAGR